MNCYKILDYLRFHKTLTFDYKTLNSKDFDY